MFGPVASLVLTPFAAMSQPAAPVYSISLSNPTDSALAKGSTKIDTAWLASIDKRGLAAYEAVEIAGGAGFTKHGKPGLIVNLKQNDKWRPHFLSSPLARPRPLPALPFRFSFAGIAPEYADQRWVIGEDAGGDEEFRLHAFVPQSGKITPWPAPAGRASQLVFAAGSESFLYAHNPPSSSRWDIRLGFWPHARKPSSQTRAQPARPSSSSSDNFLDTLFFSAPGIWSPADLDSSGNHALLIRTVSAFHTELHAFVAGHKRSGLTRLPPFDAASTVSWAKWLVPPTDSNLTAQIALIADGPHEFARLYRLTLHNDSTPTLQALSPDCACEVESALLVPSPARSHLLFTLNQDSESRLYFLDSIGGTPLPVLGLPRGVILSMTPDPYGQKAMVVITHFGTPGDLYVIDFDKVRHSQPAATLWMQAPGLNRLPKPRYALAPPHRMQVTPDHPLPPPQTTLPLWLIAPKADKPAPLVLRLHGGPELQARPGYDPLDRYLAEQWGFAIAYPDVRGSNGYGRAYLAADDQGRRPKALSDVGRLIDTLATLPELDATRFAVSGRSYGGYLAQASAIAFGRKADEQAAPAKVGVTLRSAISGVGISDFPRFLATTKSYRADLRRMEYGDERDSTQRLFLDSISPLNHMSKLGIPLLLIHGKNDPRVPYEQSELVFDKLAGRKHPTLFLTLHDEGHAARAKKARLAQMRVSAHFLVTTLQAQNR